MFQPVAYAGISKKKGGKEEKVLKRRRRLWGSGGTAPSLWRKFAISR